MKIEIGSRSTTIDLSTPQKFARALTSPDLAATVTTVRLKGNTPDQHRHCLP